MTLSIYLPGIAGRMGHIIAECIAEDPDMTLTGAFEVAGNPWIGKNLREVFPAAQSDAVVADKPTTPAGKITSIHFTAPAATLEWLDWSVAHGCPMVIGTTGFNPDQIAQVKAAAARIPIVLAPNMSVGVNLLFALCRRAAEVTGHDYDVEITEMHHRFKKDSPSGTALRLGEVIAEALDLDLKTAAVHGREGLVGERPSAQIGFHALRGGDVVGEHTVTFASLGERIELTHRASSRRTFAEGSLRAARFLASKDNGFFDMQDVLGLK